jgi:hypothetical protein
MEIRAKLCQPGLPRRSEHQSGERFETRENVLSCNDRA